MLVIMSLAVVNRDIHCSSLAIFSACLENVIIKSCKHIGVGELRAQCVFYSITPPPKQKIECQSPWKATPPLTRGSVFQSSAARHSDTAHPFVADAVPCQVTTSANCPKDGLAFRKSLCLSLGLITSQQCFQTESSSTCKWSNHLSPPFQKKKVEMEDGRANLRLWLPSVL